MIAGLAWVRGRRHPLAAPVLAGAGIGLVVLGHLAALRLPADQASPLVIASHLYALLVTVGLLVLGAAVGRTLLRPLGLAGASLQAWLFALAVGLGATAYLVLALGLVGLLKAPMVMVTLAVVSVLVRRQLLESGVAFRTGLAALLAKRAEVRAGNRVLAFTVPLLELMLGLLLLQTLAPPTGYDPLMYHLSAPKRFLELGQLTFLPDLQQANMPFTVDLLYLIGLAFGSDEMPGTLHLAFALALAIAIYSFGREHVDERTGAFGAVIFLSGTVVSVFAPMADVDFGLALFDFLAVTAFVRWLVTGRRGYLVLCGALLGLALSTKYLGGITALALGAALVWQLARRLHMRPFRQLVGDLLLFGLPAALIAAPWYLKNWVLLGSPIWPFLAPGEPALNVVLGNNVTLGREWYDWLLLPWRLYFGTAHEYPLARLPLLLLVLPLYMLLPKHRLLTGLLSLAAFHFLIWTQGAHVIRYLTSAQPDLCLGAGYVLAHLARLPRLERIGPPLAAGMLVAGLALGTACSGVPVMFQRPFLQTVGLESRETYLLRGVPNHSLVTRLNHQGEDVRGVLLIGDRRGFYLDAPTWVDVSLGAFQTLATAPDPSAARAYLDGIGVSHVLVSAPDLEWHAGYDNEARIRAWFRRFQETKFGYLVEEARYFDLTLYRMIPAEAAALRPE